MKRIPLLILCACLMLLTTATTAMGATCYTAWVSTTAYNGGATVSYAGVNYTANWWTQGNEPDTNNGGSGSGEPWTSDGACGSGGATATATKTATKTATAVGTATKTATAVGTATKTATATATSTGTGSCYTAWSYPVAYAVGALVSYNGVNYKCIQAHTSNSAWTPNVTPTLWSVVGSCSGGGGGGGTATATATATRTATGTAVKTPTPCQSNCGGGGKQFAPYMDISLGIGETVASMASSAGLHAITLAFLVDGGCVANWGGLGGSVANATFPNGTTVASAISALESEGV